MALREDTYHLVPDDGPPDDGECNLERDRDLVERCQAGDSRAFDALYIRYRRRLFRYCVQRLHEPHEAEDVVQETFARAWRALPTFAGERRFYPWLTVIANNLCVDTMRRRSRLTPVESTRLESSDRGTYETEDAVLHEVDSKMVAQAYGNLSDRHQRVLQLREGYSWSYQRIAEHEGVGVAAIETLLWRARQALKREFSSLAGPEGRVGGLVGILALLPRKLFRRLAVPAHHTGEFIRHLLSGSGPLGALGAPVAAAAGALAIGVGAVALAPASASTPPGTSTHLFPVISAPAAPAPAGSSGTAAPGVTTTAAPTGGASVVGPTGTGGGGGATPSTTGSGTSPSSTTTGGSGPLVPGPVSTPSLPGTSELGLPPLPAASGAPSPSTVLSPVTSALSPVTSALPPVTTALSPVTKALTGAPSSLPSTVQTTTGAVTGPVSKTVTGVVGVVSGLGGTTTTTVPGTVSKVLGGL
jgi:RNA polymerase sigma-70 factor (ECF subfamily)